MTHELVISRYGLFMIAWSVLDSVVQAALGKELGLDSKRTHIVTTGMQFRQRVIVLCSLLTLHGSKHSDALKLLQRAEKNARRNMLVHGHIIVGTPGQLKFVKTSALESGLSAKSVSFNAESLQTHVMLITATTNRLQSLLGVSDADVQTLADEALLVAGSSVHT
ncbi:hypothetical protein ACN9MJ_02530 [Acidovorax facilis]|uniref:hypothetical protein n=1 Tax=Acidovorax facilis TaxID=12917 RepID=UPI003CF82D06